MKKKILITQNTFTNYQYDFYENLKKHFEVKVFFLEIESDNYRFIYNRFNNDFFYKKNISLKKLVLKEKPDFLFLGGINHHKIINLDEDLKKTNTKYFYWLERVSENFLKKIYYKIFYKKILSKASGILAVGKEAQIFYKKFNKITHNLQYCINISKYKKKNSIIKNKINFLFIGQFVKRKGLQELLSALQILDEKERSIVRFTFIGDGPLKKKILNVSKSVKNIKVEKFKNRSELISYFNENEVFIFPSLYDGWGVAPMEAMISGLYLIISNQCGLIRSNLNLRKFNTVINPSKEQILKSIRFCVKNKKKINIYGKKNHYFIKNSLLNAKLNVKGLNSFLGKL